MDSIRQDYPEVDSIICKFKFYDSDTGRLSKSIEERGLNLDGVSHFQVNCIAWECVNGGFDLNRIVHLSIKNRLPEVHGSIACRGWQDRGRINKHRCNTRLEYFYSITYRWTH